MRWVWALVATVLAWSELSVPARAQAARDPLGGQFGALEASMPPLEAANQAQLLGQALAGLQAQRPGVADVYVIAASLWSDPVFESEATQAEAILRTHLGAAGRSIVLSAGTGSALHTYPVASPNNLMAAIGRVGQVMDPNEDLAVIFLTSHGSPDGTAALREGGRLQGALRPVNLRDALDAAGIHNRVIIISACYSGAFIAPLADDRTIVMTAAAPDRSSFGCRPENEWTFFGDAYFNHALRGGAAMVPAFDQARTLITQWEQEQNLSPPSNPQRYIGARAAQLLTTIERAAAQH